MQQLIHLLNKVYTGNCELAIFVVRNSYFPASLKGTRQKSEEGKNQWKHSLVSFVLKPVKNLIDFSSWSFSVGSFRKDISL